MKLIKLDVDKKVYPSGDITYYLDPNFLYIPVDLKKLLVSQDDIVFKNDLVAKDDIYSPVSGRCIGLINRGKKKYLVIENDFREILKNGRKRRGNLEVKEFFKLLEDNKKINLLNKFKSGNVLDAIVINAINDEPYVYNKIYLLKENISEILKVINYLGIMFNSTCNLLVVKNKDANIIDECLNFIGTYPDIKLSLVMDEYLLEQDVILQDKLKLKKSAVFLDVYDILDISSLISGVKRYTNMITIAGDALLESKVLRVKNYTLLGDVLNKFFNITDSDVDVVVNGLMRGKKIDDYKNFVITPDVFSITIMKKKKCLVSECIRCGKCKSVCPFGVNPLNGKNKEKCIKCGLCSYVCPSNIDLVSLIERK